MSNNDNQKITEENANQEPQNGFDFSLRRRPILKGAAATGIAGLTGAGASSVSAQEEGGPVVLMGIDAEDGGPGGHGPISVYQSVANSILSEVTNGGSGILVVGANGPGPVAFWDAIGNATGETITYVNGATQIGAVDFSGYKMLGIVSSEWDTYGGLTNLENEALITRANDIADFVNNGGGLFGFSQSGLTNPYGYIDVLGTFQEITGLGYADITPTQAGQDIGVTDDLDVCCWHDTFTEWPDFLNVLAWEANNVDSQAAALGGATVTITPITEHCVDLIAGQDIDIGEICVSNNDENLTVTYTTDGVWRLSQTHLHVADTVADVPQTRQGNPIPGRFAHQSTHDPTVTDFTYTIPLANLNAEEGDTLVIAAHADALRSLGEEIQTETAWGNGQHFVEQGNWAMYFEYEVQ